MTNKEQSKKIAGITAAIIAYLAEEEKALKSAPSRGPAPALSLWRSSGREEMMRMRMLWQLRIVPK